MRGDNTREFAERIEMSRSQLENLMQGKSSPRLATVYHIAEKLGVKPYTLFCTSIEEVQEELIEHMLKVLKILEGIENREKRKRCAKKVCELIKIMEE